MVRFAWMKNRVWGLAVSAILLAACGGRSDLRFDDGDAGPDAALDGSPDAPNDSPIDSPGDVIYDHVNDINGCNPDTCGGCCDDAGNCRTGLESSACGIGGYACVDCTAFNAGCNASTHQCGNAQQCGKATCADGCCDDDVCRPGTEHGACGTGGMECMACPDGFACDPASQKCVAAGECDPWNCSGCCDAYGQCNWGGEAWACGSEGSWCQDCSAKGQSCDPYSFTCTSGEECGPWNCNGCCDAYGYCNGGGDDWACGWGGGPCDDCWSMGLTCDPYQQTCMAQEECGPWNCDGCCDYYGYCNWGMDDWACGGGGQLCDDCTMMGGYCDPDIMACTTPTSCGPDNCEGCCDPYSGECRFGWDAWGCGTGGQICVDCNQPGSQCQTSPNGGGVCVNEASGCGPDNCEGCCDCSSSDGSCQCLYGLDPFACGSGGQICQPCGHPGVACEPSPMGGGMCVNASKPPPPPSDCGPWNCEGCCSNTYPSYCQGGLDPWECGSGGQMCEVCGPDQVCEGTWQGVHCTNVPQPDAGAGCGPWNCQGCCTPGGQCRPGMGNQRCGKGGELCQNCLVDGLTCEDGECVGYP